MPSGQTLQAEPKRLPVSEDSILALRESEARFRAAFATAPHGMGLNKPNGRWLKVNAALCTMLGYTEEELLDTDFQTITHPDDLEADMAFMDQLLDGTIPSFQMPKRYIRKDGKVMPILLSVALIRDEHGQPLYTVAQILDLTLQKEAEQRLMQAQKMEAVGQLTGGLAHDFNNLLAIVLGNLQLLEREVSGNEKAQRRTASAMQAAQRGAQLTQRLLAFSRRQILQAEVSDPNSHIIGMTELLHRSIGENIELKTSLCDRGWLINVDSNQLEMAILNLAVNARDAMPDGGELTIETSNVTLDARYAEAYPDVGPGEYFAVSVSDSGTGMPEDILAQVFEPFFTTKDVGQGSGLGLSMVFGFAKQSLGHVDLHSMEGYGTTVTIYLPRETTSVADMEPTTGTHREDYPAGHETILVVEDNEAVRDVSVSMLEALGYLVLQAENGMEALAMLARRGDIALVFTDIVMPHGMTGTDLAAVAKAKYPELRFVLTSGFAEAALTRQIDELVSCAFLAKPFKMSDLAMIIRKALDEAVSEHDQAAASRC